jgi:riboflavin kinase/FMN adenylyltransferase
MEIIYGLENWVNKYTKIAVALGNFDGVHLGHQRIIATTCGEAKAMGGIVMAMTFEPHPTKAITGGKHPCLINDNHREGRTVTQARCRCITDG